MSLIHFVSFPALCWGKWPNKYYPDPVPVDGSIPKSTRKPPKKRPFQDITNRTETFGNKRQRIEESAKEMYGS